MGGRRKQGLWSRELAEAAETRVGRLPPLRPFGVPAETAEGPIPLRAEGRMEDNCQAPVVFILEYADGLRAATLLLPGTSPGVRVCRES